jgi:alkylated DNA repair dioxygenase AlkB
MGDDPSLSYKYSGLTIVPVPWTPNVQLVRDKLKEMFPEYSFNTCLCNQYRDGDDNLGWHDDQDLRRYGAEVRRPLPRTRHLSDARLRPQPTIASVSFGTERFFRLRRKDKSEPELEFALGQGAVLIMGGRTQQFWDHSVPKQKTIKFDRINLTFRKVLLAEEA